MSDEMTPTPESLAIPGYTYGRSDSARSPITDAEFDALKATLLWSDADAKALQMAHGVLVDQVEDVLDVWYGFVGSTPHLARYFSGADGEVDPAYLGAVRKRFAAWILDTTRAHYDRTWLDYQFEIGLRHTPLKKNRTDAVRSASEVVHMRYLVAFIVPLTVTMRPFLATKGHSALDVEAMHQAWFKAVTLTATLWAQPYVPAADY